MSKAKKKPGKKVQVLEQIDVGALEKKCLKKLEMPEIYDQLIKKKGRNMDLQQEVMEYYISSFIKFNLQINDSLANAKKSEEKSHNFKQLQNEFYEKKNYYENEIKNQITSYQTKLSDMNTKYGDQLFQLKETAVQLKQDLQYWEAFPIRDKQYHETIEQLNNELVDQLANQKEEIKKLQKSLEKQKQFQDNQHQENLKQIHEEARLKAQAVIEDKEQKQKMLNERLLSNIHVVKKELNYLDTENSQLDVDNQQIRTSQFANPESLTDQQTLNHRSTLKIKKLKEKIEFLKKYISTEIANYEKDLESLKKNNWMELKNLEQSTKNLKQSIIVKSNDLTNLKALCQMILDQRSDIEQYFYEALYDTLKIQIPLDQTASQQNTKLASSLNYIKTQIMTMPMNEREQILRGVFARMNSGIPPIPWRGFNNEQNQEQQEEKESEMMHQNEQQIQNFGDDSNRFFQLQEKQASFTQNLEKEVDSIQFQDQ